MTIEQQIKEHLEKVQISDLLIRYFRSIDDKQFDINIIESTFTGEARIVRPNGSVTFGHENILDVNRKSFARFKATHHVTTDYIIDITGDTAMVRANLTGMHLWAEDENNPIPGNKSFHAGVVITAKATRIENKWRLDELTYRNVWRTGEGISEIAKFALTKD